MIHRSWVALSLILLAMCCSNATAGVIVTQQFRIAGAAQPSVQTIEVQGHRLKLDTSLQTEIIDLDKHTYTLVNKRSKSYLLNTFPSAAGHDYTPLLLHLGLAESLKRTAKTRTVAKFSCTEYTATSGAVVHYSFSSCFSTVAPGQSDVNIFNGELAKQLSAMKFAEIGTRVPEGISLANQAIRLLDPGQLPHPLANTTSTKPETNPLLLWSAETSTIRVLQVADQEFSPPAGYHQLVLATKPPVLPKRRPSPPRKHQ
jgi:hypothetical protein